MKKILMLYAMSVDNSVDFDVSGITENMTREQIQEIWGEPDLSETMSVIYCDGEYENSRYIDKIVFGFDDTSGRISDISFFVSLDRIQQQADK